jgi:hypothetical protein
MSPLAIQGHRKEHDLLKSPGNVKLTDPVTMLKTFSARLAVRWRPLVDERGSSVLEARAALDQNLHL